jgi:CubicO group peptidase (beta-lactamase class C family)
VLALLPCRHRHAGVEAKRRRRWIIRAPRWHAKIDAMSTNVQGRVDPGFGKVADAFARNFADHGEVGAGFALYVEGRNVVDIWGGVADPATGEPYGEDTLQLVFSTTKGMTAACANLLVARGVLDVDAPVSQYWPEFAQVGKETIPLRWLLCHKAGLPTIDARLTLEEALVWEPVVRALAAQKPYWEPGKAHGYHALTFGWLVGEVVRRVSGKGLGSYLAEEVSDPLGLEMWIGLPAEYEPGVAPMITSGFVPEDPKMRQLMEAFMGPATLAGRALSLNGAFEWSSFNLPEVHAAEIGAAGGITNARSLARFYAGLIGPLENCAAAPLLTPAQIDAARMCQTDGADKVLTFDPNVAVETRFGLGWMVSSAFSPFGGAGAFGHPGAGGSVGFADPDNHLAAGYVMNKMRQDLAGDPRADGLIRASYEAIGVAI